MKIIITLLYALLSLNLLNAATPANPFTEAFFRCVTQNSTAATKAMLTAVADKATRKHLVNSKDASGKTALIYAVIKNNKHIAADVSASGADINACDNEGKTALMHACINHRMEMAKALLTLGTTVNVQDINGWTALMFAAKWTYIEIAELLLLNAADCSLTNSDGQTAEDVAIAELTKAREVGFYYAEEIARIEDMIELIGGRRPIPVSSALHALLPNCSKLLYPGEDDAITHDAMVMAMHRATLSEPADTEIAPAKVITDAAKQRRGTNNKNRRKNKK